MGKWPGADFPPSSSSRVWEVPRPGFRGASKGHRCLSGRSGASLEPVTGRKRAQELSCAGEEGLDTGEEGPAVRASGRGNRSPGAPGVTVGWAVGQDSSSIHCT